MVYKSDKLVARLGELAAGEVVDSGLVEHICLHRHMLLHHSSVVVAVATVLDAVVVLDSIFQLVVHFQHDLYSSGLVEASGYPPCLILTCAFLLCLEEFHLFVY